MAETGPAFRGAFSLLENTTETLEAWSPSGSSRTTWALLIPQGPKRFRLISIVTVTGAQGETHTPDSGYTEGTEEDSGGNGQAASNATKAILSTGTEQPTATWSGTNNRLGIVGAVINHAP